MKKSPKSPKKQSAKITKLKMRVGEITSLLLQNHPKMVRMRKGGSSGYADLFMSKQLMKGGKMDTSTETKIVKFLNDNDTMDAVKALKDKVIGNGETTQGIKDEFYKELYDYKLCDKYEIIKNDDLKEDLITLDIVNKFYNLVKDKVILAINNTKYKINPKQPVIDGTPAAANVEEAAAAAAEAAAAAAVAAAEAVATEAEEKAAETAKAATAKEATAKEATGEAAEAAIAAAEEAAAAAEEAAAEAVVARNNVAIKKAEAAATKAEAKATAATATATAAKATAAAATEAAKEATGEATEEAAEAAIAAAEEAIAAAEEAAAEAVTARNNVAIKKAEAAIKKAAVPGAGGKLPAKYKSLGIAVHILYKKRKYKRTIYVKDKKKTKYCKIDGEYILLSKMKVIA